MGMAQAPCELHRVFPYLYLFMGGVLEMCVFLSVDIHRDASCLKQSFCNTEGSVGKAKCHLVAQFCFSNTSQKKKKKSRNP